MSSVPWSTSSDAVLVKKMSLRCLGKNTEGYICGVYLYVCRDTSTILILQINHSTTHHKMVNQGALHVGVSVWGFCMVSSLAVSIFHCSLLRLYLGVNLFPRVGRTLPCLLGWLCLLQASSPAEPPGMSVQAGLSGAFLSNRRREAKQKAPLCAGARLRALLKGLINCCPVVIVGFDWFLTCMLTISSQQTLMSSAQIQ